MSISAFNGANLAFDGTDTFETLFVRTNQILANTASVVLFADNSSDGFLNTGNVNIAGFFSANTIIVNSNIQGGTKAVPADLTFSDDVSFYGALTINSNVNFQSTTTIANFTLASGSVSNSSFTNVTISSASQFNTVDINSGAMNGITIGASNPNTFDGTTISATDFVGDLTGDVTGDITSNSSSTFTTVDINGGSLDNMVVGASATGTGAFTSVSTSNVTISTGSSISSGLQWGVVDPLVNANFTSLMIDNSIEFVGSGTDLQIQVDGNTEILLQQDLAQFTSNYTTGSNTVVSPVKLRNTVSDSYNKSLNFFLEANKYNEANTYTLASIGVLVVNSTSGSENSAMAFNNLNKDDLSRSFSFGHFAIGNTFSYSIGTYQYDTDTDNYVPNYDYSTFSGNKQAEWVFVSKTNVANVVNGSVYHTSHVNTNTNYKVYNLASNYTGYDTTVLEIRTDGDMFSMGSFGSLSDESLKKDIVDVDDYLDKIMKLRVVKFRWKGDTPRKERPKILGLVADEVEKHLPEVVETGSDGYKLVKYSDMLPMLVTCEQKLKKDYEELIERMKVLIDDG